MDERTERRDSGALWWHLRALWWRLRIVWLALRWVPRINIGDEVEYAGETWIATQGVRDPRWAIRRGEQQLIVHKRELRKVRSLENYIRSFRSGQRFYHQNWFPIWVSRGWRMPVFPRPARM